MERYGLVREVCARLEALAGLAPGRLVAVGYEGKAPPGFCALAVHVGDRVVVVEVDGDLGVAFKDPGRGEYELAARWGDRPALAMAADALATLVGRAVPPQARGEAEAILAELRSLLARRGAGPRRKLAA